MRKVKPIKIVYRYVGEESPEKKAESEKIMEEFFDKLFNKALDNLRKKKGK